MLLLQQEVADDLRAGVQRCLRLSRHQWRLERAQHLCHNWDETPEATTGHDGMVEISLSDSYSSQAICLVCATVANAGPPVE